MTDPSATARSTTEASSADSKSEESLVGSNIDYTRFLDCVHCGLCTSFCPTYLETGNENDSPRGRIYLMRGVVDGRVNLTDSVQRHLDLCLDCRSCETACPSGVQYGRLIEPFRVDAQRNATGGAKGGPNGDWFQRLVLYGLFPYPARMRLALWPMRIMQSLGLDRLIDKSGLNRLLPEKLRRMQSLLPPLQPSTGRLPELLPAKGRRRARVGLFTGCVADAVFGQTNWATARVLQENGCDVVVPRNQVCCGAIHYHSGSEGPALEFAETNSNAFSADELDAVIVNVAGCGSMLKDYGHMAEESSTAASRTYEVLEGFSGKVRDAAEFLAELGPIAPQGPIRKKATYHDACHLVHAQQVRDQPRKLLELIPELELVPLAESEICCGAAGSYNLTEPEMADQLGRRKRENILRTGAEIVVTGNAGCSLQIQSMLRSAKRPLWVAHPMDLLDLSYRGLAPPLS